MVLGGCTNENFRWLGASLMIDVYQDCLKLMHNNAADGEFVTRLQQIEMSTDWGHVVESEAIDYQGVIRVVCYLLR